MFVEFVAAGSATAARVVLAAVFALSGASKLAAARDFRAGLRALEVPERLVPPVARLWPALELAAAALVLPLGFTRSGAIAALVLLTLATVVIWRAVREGRAVSCACFGRLSGGTLGWRTVVRNGALAALALWLATAATPGTNPRDETRAVSPAAWTGWIVLAGAIGGGLLTDAWRRTSRRPPASPRWATGAPRRNAAAARPPAPDFSLPAADGTTVALAQLVAHGRPVLLVFTHPGCGRCADVPAVVRRWQRDPRLTVAVVTTPAGDGGLPRSYRGIRTVLLQRDREVALAYGVSGLPAAIVVDRSGALAAGPADDIEAAAVLAADV